MKNVVELFRISLRRRRMLAAALAVGLTAAGASADDVDRLYVNDKKAPESLRDLRKIQEALEGGLERARAATVGVELKEGGAGSGVIVSEDGLVLTAAHVSGGVGEELVMITADGERHDAISLGLVAGTDAAMVKIKEEGTYPFVDLDGGDSTRLGDWVFSLGHSGGYDKDRGVVVRLGRIVRVAEETIQSDCKLIGGDSGGPLFDMNGRLIGIHSRVGASLEQNMHVPIREFHRNWEGLLASEFIGEGPFAKKPEPGKAFLGVAAESRDDGGVELTRVMEDTAAEAAGLETGDVVLEIDGEEIEDMDEFLEVLKAKAPGDEIELSILRNGEEKTIEVELGER